MTFYIVCQIRVIALGMIKIVFDMSHLYNYIINTLYLANISACPSASIDTDRGHHHPSFITLKYDNILIEIF